MKRILKTVTIVFFTLVLVMGFSGVALAHARVEIGKYEMTFGADDEPKVSGRRTTLIFYVTNTETEALVEGLEETVNMALSLGGVEVELEVGTVYGQPGRYRAFVYFTEGGMYEIHFDGIIEELPFDIDIEFEVEDTTKLMFPEVVDISAIAEEVEHAQEHAAAALAAAQDVDDKASTNNTMVMIALVLSGIAIVGMVFSLVRRR